MWSVHSLWPCCFVLSWLCRSRVVKWRCCLPCARSLSLSLSHSLSFLSLSLCPFSCLLPLFPPSLYLLIKTQPALSFALLPASRLHSSSTSLALSHSRFLPCAFSLSLFVAHLCIPQLQVCNINSCGFRHFLCCFELLSLVFYRLYVFRTGQAFLTEFCFCVSSQRQVSCRKGRKEVREDTSQCDERDAGRAGGMRKRFKWKKSRITIKCLIWMLRKPFSVSTSERSLPRWLERVRVRLALARAIFHPDSQSTHLPVPRFQLRLLAISPFNTRTPVD